MMPQNTIAIYKEVYKLPELVCEEHVSDDVFCFYKKTHHFVVVFGPNGTVGVCMTYYATGKYFVKFDKDFDPFTNQIWNEWSKRMPINMPKCLKCEALGICGGGCPFNADTRNGSIWEVDDFFCEHSKRTLEWLIWELFDSMKK